MVERYTDTPDQKNPPSSLLRPHAHHSPVLVALVGSVVAFFLLVGVGWMFWAVSHPRPSVLIERERAVGSSGAGYYFTEGGHDPIRRPRSTRDELNYRGALTPPSEVRGR